MAFALSRMQPLRDTSISGNAEAGAALFFGKGGCAQCHMIWGRGSVNGPDLTEAAHKLTLAQVETALRKPAVRAGDGYQVASVRTAKGETIRGFVRNESGADLQMQSFDGRLHLLSKSEVVRIDRKAQAPMPAWTGSPEAMRDLIKFLQQAPDRQASANGRGPQPMPGAIEWNEIVKPKPGEWPTYKGSERQPLRPARPDRPGPTWHAWRPVGLLGSRMSALEATPW